MKKSVVLAGLLAAMVFLTTYFLHIPIVGGGYVHLGDTVIYLAAALLPMPLAMAAAVVGAGLADVLAAPMWTVATVLIKATMVMAFTSKNERLLCARNRIAPVIAGAVGVVGYYLAELVILWLSGSSVTVAATGALAAVPFNALQELVGGIAFVLLAAALDRMQFKQRLAQSKR